MSNSMKTAKYIYRLRIYIKSLTFGIILMLMFISGLNEAKADTNCSLCSTDWKYKSFNEEVGNDSNNCKSSLIIKFRDCPTNNKEIQIVSMKIDTSCTGFNLVNYINNAHTFLLKRAFNLFQISNSPTSFDIRIIDSKCIKKFGDVIEACDDSCTSNDYTISRYDTTQTGGSVQYTYKISNVIHHHTFGLCIGGSTGCTFTGMMGSPNNTFITQYNNLTETDCTEICYWKLIGNDNVAPTNWLGTKNDVPLVIKTNNVEKMRVTETGKVGIGTSSPFGSLDINCGLWDFNLGKVSITHSATAIHVPQIRLYSTLGTVPYPKDEMNYPLVSWFIEHDAGKLNFRSGDEKVLGNEDPKTKVTFLQDGNVGINNTAPTAKLQVTNGSILFNGTTGSTPTSGAGTRMMWIPEKAAFRAGALDNTANPTTHDDNDIEDPEVSSTKTAYWDANNIGTYSIALGRNVKAYGLNDIAIGTFAVANSNKFGPPTDYITARNAIAIGYSAYATGNYALSIGNGCQATTAYSSAFGYSSNASGDESSAIGNHNYSYGYASSAFGISNTANNSNSSAFGYGNTAYSERSIAIGCQNNSQGIQTMTLGQYCTSDGTGSITIGSGEDASHHLTNSINNSIFFGIHSLDPTMIIRNTHTFVTGDTTKYHRGNVGIRTPDPQGSLSVNTDNDKGVIIGNTWANDASTPGSGSDLVVERKVGIGTQSPSCALQVSGSGDNNQVAIWNGSVSVPTDVDLIVQDKVLIGTSSVLNTSTSPDYKLQINGSIWLSTGSFYHSSDLSLKKDIIQYNDGLNQLKQIQTKKYRYNGKFGFTDNDEHVGIIAQELQNIIPYAIHQDSITQQILVKPSITIDSVLDYSFYISVIDYNSELDSNRHHKTKDTLIIDKRNQKITHPAIYRSETSPILTYNTDVLPFLLVNSVKELDNLRINDSTNLETKIKDLDIKYNEIINSQTYQKQIDSLGVLVINQASQIKDLQEKYESIKKCCESNSIDLYEDVLLEQNNPNPFDQETKISYFIPERLNAPFTMIILDNKNNTIEQYPLTQNIPTTMTISSKNYVTGVYTYSILDATRNIIKSKKMMIIK